MSMDSSAEAAALEVGSQVRAVDTEPVFASDPKSGDAGEVVEASGVSYLVRWESGSKTWMQRANLEPAAGADPVPLEAHSAPVPAAAPRGPGRYVLRYGGIILFGLLTARGWIPALRDAAWSPTPGSIAVIVLVIVAIAAVIAVSVRRVSGMNRTAGDKAASEEVSDET